ncbi:hypothetical protein [Cecembia sp.]|uniref:hypothetical protein n=1 Tax=Cecembia sp. TaxID=1898110 RepID=UPI0025B994B4|nr:hypothetical protein [Cecembia sp.]
MRSIIPFLFLVFIAFTSCNQDDKEPEFSVAGYWNLIQIVPSWPVPDYDGKVIDFNEKYIFNHDGSFIKFSNRPKGIGEKLQVPVQALGVYTFSPMEHGNDEIIYEVKLVFDTNPEMAANCGEANTEYLFITKSNKLVNTSWSACDGLGYVYSKSK